jgi:hypothetical protein
MDNLRTCLKCGTVHMGVTRAEAEFAVKKFNEHYATLTAAIQWAYYGGTPASLAFYETCWCGATGKDTRPTKDGDVPEGCTIGPIIWEDET